MRLTENDASFLYTETASGPMHTAIVYVVDGELPFEKVHAHFAARMHLVPRYRQKLALVPFNLSHPKWVDDPDFDLDYHLEAFSVPEGSTLEAAMDKLLELNEKLLDRSRPLWKTYVVDGVPGQTLLLQQVHHAMIDGVSAVELSMVLLDFEPDAAPPAPPKEVRKAAPTPSAIELITEAVRENVESLTENPLASVHTDRKSLQLLANAGRAMSRFFTSPAITAPWNAGVVGPKRKVRWSSHDFAEFREIRRALGGTINDVVLAVVSEGAARYLDRCREDTANKHFRIMCPVSVRTEDEQGALGNRVSGIFPTLPAWSMDILDRLKAVCTETARIKSDEEAQALTLMNETSMSMPPVAMAPTLLVGTRFDPTVLAARMPLPIAPKGAPRPPFFGFNFTCTNVPGVQVAQYLAGHEITSMVAFLMLSGPLGYGVAVTSYNQRMLFNYISESRLMPDLDVMAEAVEEAFAELLGEARKINPPASVAPEIESVAAKIRKSEKKSGKKSGKKSAPNPTKRPTKSQTKKPAA
jgi:diacylglycerol O-acyltransferase